MYLLLVSLITNHNYHIEISPEKNMFICICNCHVNLNVHDKR